MSETGLTTKQNGAAVLEQVIIQGDLKELSSAQRVEYYRHVCDSLGINYLTKPFDYITLNGRLTLYAKRDATDQLRKRHGVSIVGLVRERMEDVYVVTARARDRDGREDESIGVVSIANLKGDALANAMMKCETKAKRRVTLSIVGLGWLDETEVETVRDGAPVNVDVETGEIVDAAKPTRTPHYSRAQLQAAYVKHADKANALNWQPEPFNAGWADEEIMQRGEAIKRKNAEIEEALAAARAKAS